MEGLFIKLDVMNKILFQIFAIVLIATFFGSCSGDDSKPGDTVFIVKLSSGHFDRVFVQEESGTVNNVDTILLSDDGTFKFVKRLEKPAYFSFYVDQSKLVIYLRPNDTLRFEDGGGSIEKGKFFGGSVIYNDYLLKYNIKKSEFQENANLVFSHAEAKAVAKMDSIRKTDMDNLESLAKSFENVDELFLDAEKERIKYSWALNRLLYPLYYSHFNNVPEYKTSPEFDNYLKDININDSKLLNIGEYRNFLNNYLGVKAEAYFKDSTIEANEKSFTVYQLKVIGKEFENADVKSYLAFKTMFSHVMYEGLKDYELIMPEFTKICKSESLVNSINDFLKTWSHLKKGQPALDFNSVSINGDTVAFSSLKGKYIYVDVWATWCEPCKAEIPHLKSLVDEFANKNIAFVSLSVDNNKIAWEAMVKAEGLKGLQLYLGLNKEFAEFYKVTGIPRFMLFDKDGKILETNADRPSSDIKSKLLALPGI